MKKLILAATMVAAAACAQPARKADKPIPANPGLKVDMAELQKPSGSVLFWSQEQRNRDFRRMEAIFPGHVVKARGPVRLLPKGEPLKIDTATVDAYLKQWNTAGLIVLKDGKVVLERYGLDFGPNDRWTSFSVAKSFTSTLAGAAIKDGYIKSLTDPVTRYIPELAGSGYDGVTVQQLLTMTSGVKWNEDYTDPNSDVARMLSVQVKPGEDPTVAYMRTLPRDTAPGTKWVYKTGETNLIGVLVHRATGRVLSNYLSEKVWGPAGMERDGFWMTDQTGQEISGCCLSLTLRDYARMGQFALEGGKGSVPADWFADATREHAPIGMPGFGYGYQWWTYPGGLFGGQGIFGQSITVDPKNKIVIAMLSSWPKASDREQSMQRFAFMQQLMAAAVK
jgi:CubicO group peptidase (beta-lactamase class C family)